MKLQRKLVSHQAGFTLIEVVAAAALTGVIMVSAGWGLAELMRNDQRVEEQATTRMNLSRALDFISDDIRSAASVSTSLPSGWTAPSGYNLVFSVRKISPNLFDPPISTSPLVEVTDVAYYTRTSSGTDWRGPRVIYRSTASNSGGNPLIDGISSSAPTCSQTVPGTGSVSDSGSGNGGFRVYIRNSRNVKVCILGNLSKGYSGTYEAETLSAVRSGT